MNTTRFFLLQAILTLCLNVFSQIPGILQQPQWAMPFFFEDANGEKDTVWIGYDPNAKHLPSDADSLFERFNFNDSTLFQAALYWGLPYPMGAPTILLKRSK